jgi:hypothetical protein
MCLLSLVQGVTPVPIKKCSHVVQLELFYMQSFSHTRSQRAPAILPSANLEQQGLAPPVPSRVIFEEKPLSPVSVVVEDLGKRHPASHGEGVDSGLERLEGEKCEFVQMKGEGGEGCHKGGMSCEKKCTYSTGEPVCTTGVTVSSPGIALLLSSTLFSPKFISRMFVRTFLRRCVIQ